MRSADIELEESECGSCAVALKGDLDAIKCENCYYLARGIELSPELQDAKDKLDAKNRIKITSLADCMLMSLSPNTIKPEIFVDPGVDRTEMNEMSQVEAKVIGKKTWIDSVSEMTTGDFVKFDDGTELVLKIVKTPVAGPIEFKQQDGSVKVNDGLTIEVLVDDSPEIKTWTITAKSLMQQLKAISVNNGMGANIVGATFRVTASGMGMQRKYFVKLLQKPGVKEDKGANWLAGQKKEATAEQGGQ